jgi:hypothetical protein
MDLGMDTVEVSARFIDSPEFRGMYGDRPSNAEFLWNVYSNVLDRAPDQAGFDWWLNQMNSQPRKDPGEGARGLRQLGRERAALHRRHARASLLRPLGVMSRNEPLR